MGKRDTATAQLSDRADLHGKRKFLPLNLKVSGIYDRCTIGATINQISFLRIKSEYNLISSKLFKLFQGLPALQEVRLRWGSYCDNKAVAQILFVSVMHAQALITKI